MSAGGARRGGDAGEMAGRRSGHGRRMLLAIAAVVVVVLGSGLYVVNFVKRDEPELHADIRDHFKYGSIGSEATAGVPYDIFLVLPTVFSDLLPEGRGKGWERIGFIYEPNHVRPIGTSYREDPIGRVGLNCAVCHSSLVQDSPTAPPPRVVLGMPANQFRIESFIRFLRDAAKDPRFTPDEMIPAMKKADPDFSLRDELLYRHFVIPRTREALQRIGDDFAWMERRPPQGPGRVDTFNPYKFRVFGLGTDADTTVGTADFPSLWNQTPRQGMHLHWDGNNTSVAERNISAAIGAGVDPGRDGGKSSLDEPSMARLLQWINELPAPRYPAERIDRAEAARGADVFNANCAACHSLTGARVGQVTPIAKVGTDRERLDSFTPELAKAMNTLGRDRPWAFHNFQKTDGYANEPLDGLWLRAPFLHNGSVPNLVSLLLPPDQRPTVFYRGYYVYDWDRVGFVSQGPEAERGFRFDTSVRGNGNGGHAYGTDLPARQKRALIEYLKTL